MSKPNLRRYKATKTSVNAADGMLAFLRSEFPAMIDSIEEAFGSLRFDENFAGKVVEVALSAFTQTSIPNPLGVVPSGFVVLDNPIPGLVKGSQWDRDFLTFNSSAGRIGVIGTSVTVDTANDTLTFNDASPHFFIGQQVQVRSLTGAIPGGLTSGKKYWVKGVSGTGNVTFTLSELQNGPRVNITSAGSGTLEVSTFATMKILLLR